jgi:cystathionine beta-lyase family protein involved in aluminum resistance
MDDTPKKNNQTIEEMKERISTLLKDYRIKHDELELAEEEWDIGEIQEALANYTKEINILKKKVLTLEKSA